MDKVLQYFVPLILLFVISVPSKLLVYWFIELSPRSLVEYSQVNSFLCLVDYVKVCGFPLSTGGYPELLLCLLLFSKGTKLGLSLGIPRE